jgi:hypothetical protein
MSTYLNRAQYYSEYMRTITHNSEQLLYYEAHSFNNNYFPSVYGHFIFSHRIIPLLCLTMDNNT